MNLPVISIVGRPNVGKSSLFNRFLQRHQAVVDEQPGVTRDRNYAICDWNGRSFHLVDTGGIVPDTRNMMEKSISDQAEFAINEADLILLVVDVQTGIDRIDLQIGRELRKADKNVVLAVNKVDGEDKQPDVYEFYKLGLDDPFAVSAATGTGIGDLLDELVERLPAEVPDVESGDDDIRVALVGRPNVGKSSFINQLIGEDRLIVTPIAGTTRDAIDTPFEIDGQQYILVDTAGLRRKYKVNENIEFYTTIRTARAIEGSDVAVVMVDATTGVTAQDQRVLDQVLTVRRAAVLAINKWDLVEKDSKTADKYTLEINDILARHAFLPVIYISALTGQRVSKVMALVKEVYDESHKRISTSELNRWMEQALGRRRPPAKQGKYIKFNYVTQTEVAPPTFVFFLNRPKMVDKTYIAYLTNRLRDEFGFKGVPIRLKFKRK